MGAVTNLAAAKNVRIGLAPGFVYFLRCSELVKIGFSRDPDLRAKNIASMSPLGLSIVGLHPATRRDEAYLHRLFAARRKHGEWFEWCSEIAEVAERGLPQLAVSDVQIDLDKASRAGVIVAAIVCPIARRIFPHKTGAELAYRTGYTSRTCEYWLSGTHEISARALVALLLSDIGPEILAGLRTNGANFVK